MRQIEIQAIAWSYAAALALDIDPALLFHEGGYAGRGPGLLQNFALGVFFGVDGLEAAGLTVTGKDPAHAGLDPYPHMIKWLRE